jgi:hypothetical protein
MKTTNAGLKTPTLQLLIVLQFTNFEARPKIRANKP